MGWFSRGDPTPAPLSARAVKRAALRCSSHARAYWACVDAASRATVASHLAQPTRPSSTPPACEKLRDSLTHCLCESAFREVADAWAHCTWAAAARGDFSGAACGRERAVMVAALRAAGLGPALDTPPGAPARHERARAARRAAAGGA
jgi:hypothetical protein